jgi:hypothetical protein
MNKKATVKKDGRTDGPTAGFDPQDDVCSQPASYRAGGRARHTPAKTGSTRHFPPPWSVEPEATLVAGNRIHHS